MEITPTIQLALALFWTLSASAGIVITLPNLLTAHRGWRRLDRTGLDRALAVMAWSHVQADALRLLMHVGFFLLGVSRLLGPPFVATHTDRPAAYWLGVVALMTVPCELIAVTLLARHARRTVARVASDDGWD